MKYYPHPILAREGWLFIGISVCFALLIWNMAGFLPAIPFILVAGFVIQFFRDPPRVIPQQSDAVLAPADGKVICVENVHDDYQNVPAIKVSIFMNVFNVHSNRSSVDGEVLEVKYIPGAFVNADLDKASTDNERNAVIIRMANGHKITLVQIAGLVARRILCYTKVGAWLKRGERYGFIRFGSRVDVYLPVDTKVLVSIGQKVKATETIIARIN